MKKEIKVSRVELLYWSRPRSRKIKVHLSNGGCAYIARCWESWEIYNATFDEKRVCQPIAEQFNDWLHEGIEE